MSYRTVKESFWTDPKIRQLSSDEKLLFLYCVTNPHSHYAGIYYLPIIFMVEETGMSRKALDQCLANLESMLLIRYDKVTSTMFVVKMFKHQNGVGGNPKVIRSGVEKQLQNIHSHILIKAFIEEYQHLNLTLPQGCINVDSTFSQGTVPVPDTVPDTVPDINTPTVKKKNHLSPKDPEFIFTLPDWVGPEVWAAYEEMRMAKKKPPTDKARTLVVKELERLKQLGHDPTTCLEQSIRNGWTDVYEVKNGSGKGNRTRNTQAGAGGAGSKAPGDKKQAGTSAGVCGVADDSSVAQPGKYEQPKPGDVFIDERGNETVFT